MNIFDEAYRVLLNNSREGKTREGQEYFYICPASGKYPFQWLWDSCFHAVVMAHFEPKKARRELLTLLSCVNKEGFLPHIIFWQGTNLITDTFNKFFWGNRRHSLLTQPPVVGIALEKVYKKDKDKKFLKKALPAAKKYYLWLARERDIDGNGLVAVIHPFESRDEAPEIDYVSGFYCPDTLILYRWLVKTLWQARKSSFSAKKIYESKPNNFYVADLLFNCVFAQGLKALGRLCLEIADEEAGKFQAMSLRVEQAILKLCFNKDDQAYYSLWWRDQRQLPVLTIASLFPLILDSTPKEHVKMLVENHLLNPAEFWLPYPIPCVAANNPSFNPSGIYSLWRGPTWINVNWLLVQGLRKHGYQNLTDEIAGRAKEMILREGFWEFYNPFTGKGLRTKNYSWSTLIVDMLKDS